MLLTNETKTEAMSLVEGPDPDGHSFPDRIRQRVLNSAVKLFASVQKAVFIGSGAIFNLDARYVYIITAAHNAMKLAGLEAPPPDWSDCVSDFADKINIAYGSADMGFNQHPTGNVTAKVEVESLPIQSTCLPNSNCMYDVLVIKTKDAALHNYARQFVFGNQSIADVITRISKEIAKVKYEYDELLNSGKYYFVQLGYGNITDTRDKITIEGGLIKIVKLTKRSIATGMTANNLHYRLAYPSYKEIRDMFDQIAPEGQAPNYVRYTNTIALGGHVSSTTAPGDSGGPLYAVDKNLPEAYLIGVTTGADMFVIDHTNQIQTFKRAFRNTISTSVAPYYSSIS